MLAGQWEFVPSGQGYAIRSNALPSQPFYATVEALHDEAPIVASPYPATWVLQHFVDGLRFVDPILADAEAFIVALQNLLA